MILDTNAFSALADGDDALGRRLAETAVLAVPTIVLGEFRYGIRESRHRAAYAAWLEDKLSVFDVLSIDAATAEAYAEIRHELKTAGKPIPANDLWIAALARQYRLPLVTRDRHFGSVPKLEVIDW
jgi:tRNA(fMet)-specific endonuclease VapC